VEEMTWTVVRALLNIQAVRIFLALIVFIVALGLYAQNEKRQEREQILRDIEIKTLQQRERYQNDHQTIQRRIQSLDTEQRRRAASEWMR
jgi:hypothetical protein